MNTRKTLLAVAATLAALVCARAQTHPFQAALWAPDLQLVPAHEDIRGLRLQVYGQNENVSGLDIGLVNVATGDFAGVSAGLYFLPALYNRVDGQTNGWQLAAINVTGGHLRGWQGGLVSIHQDMLEGLQSSIVNWNEPSISALRGVQLGFVNVNGAVEGLQLGLVNYATTLRGVQLGLWNEVATRPYGSFEPLPRVFPVINIGF